MGVHETPSPQQLEPQSAGGFVQTVAQQPDPMVTNVGAPAAAQQSEKTGARDRRQTFAQHLEPTGSVSGVRTHFRSMSAPPSLQTLPVHQPQLPQHGFQGSMSGSSSDWISNATDTTNCTTGSLHSNHARHKDHKHTDDSEDGNWAGRNVPHSGTLQQDTGKPMQSENTLSTDGPLIPEGTQNEQPHDSSSGSASITRKDPSVSTTSSTSSGSSTTSNGSDCTKPDILSLQRSSILDSDEEDIDKTSLTTPLMHMLDARQDISVTTTSSMISRSSTTSSGSDSTKPDTFGLQGSSILDSDEEDVDETSLITPLMDMIDAYSEYCKRVKQPPTDEYIMSMIKPYVDIASSSTAAMHVIAREVFCSSYDAESPARESPLQVTEEVAKSELCASLERRLQAVTDYVRTTTDETTEAAIAEMMIQEIDVEIRMAESGVLPHGVPGSVTASSDVGHDIEVQDGGEQREAITCSESGVCLGGEKEGPMEGISAEETYYPMQIDYGSVKHERELQVSEVVETSSVEMGTTKEDSERYNTFSCGNHDIDWLRYHFSRCIQYFYPLRNIQSKVDKTLQKAVVLKTFSLAQARVCVIRTMNSVMLRCLKMVITIVNQALEANRVAHRAMSETGELRSAGTSGDYIAAIAEATKCAETAVRQIEEAVKRHKLVVDALYVAEGTLLNIKTETADGVELLLHLISGVELIELKVIRECRTYLDQAKDGNSSDSGSSDVFQALKCACHSSVNAVVMMVKGLWDFSVAKQRQRRSSGKK